MPRIREAVGGAVAAAFVAAALSAAPADAQSVASSEAQQFIGKWTLTLEAPAGGAGGGAARPGGGGGGAGGGRMGGPMVIDIADADGRLAATLTGGMMNRGQPREIETISRSGENLVLSYSVSMGGQSAPVTITLTPATDGMKAALELGSMVTLNGTAAKE